jgi:hypothetical protein
VNFLELQDEVLSRFGESTSDPRTVSREEAKDAINDGLDDLSIFCSFYETNRMLSVAEDSIYHYTPTALGTDVLYITQVQSLNTQFWLEADSQLAMDSRVYSMWEQSFFEPHTIIPLNVHWFGIHGRRADNQGKMRAYCVALHPHLNGDYDVPDFPTDYHEGLVEYALGELHLLDHELSDAVPHFVKYFEIRDQLSKLVNNRFSPDRVAMVTGGG